MSSTLTAGAQPNRTVCSVADTAHSHPVCLPATACLLCACMAACPPAVVAAAVLICDRKARGLPPYWPTALSSLTGHTAASTPELAAAVAGAQRLYDKLQVPAALWNYQAGASATAGNAAGRTAGGSEDDGQGTSAPAPVAGSVAAAAAAPGRLHPAALAAPAAAAAQMAGLPDAAAAAAGSGAGSSL
jgi:hypothetical protein